MHFAVAAIDGFFPPVPSEMVLPALALQRAVPPEVTREEVSGMARALTLAAMRASVHRAMPRAMSASPTSSA